jgi:hypothetical protein
MLSRTLLGLKIFWNRMLEIEVRYTSVPMWSPWRDFTFKRDEDLQSSR